MLLLNENLQQINVEELKTRLAIQLESTTVPSEEEITKDLGNYFQQTHAQEFKSYGLNPSTFISLVDPSSTISPNQTGKTVLQKIKKFVCGFLNAGSTLGDIIDAVLKAISSIIPGGIIVELIVKKLVKYIVSKGVATFCAI